MSLVADNEGISLEDQVDVTLFTSVDAIEEFLNLPGQKRVAKYPSSVFRIVTNRRLFVGPSGFFARISSNHTWQSTFPAILVFHGSSDDGLEALQDRPNLKITRFSEVCAAFVSFQSAEFVGVKETECTSLPQAQVLG